MAEINWTDEAERWLRDIHDYEKLLKDLHDLATIAEHRDEPTIAFKELKKQLKEDSSYEILWKRLAKRGLRNMGDIK